MGMVVLHRFSLEYWYCWINLPLNMVSIIFNIFNFYPVSMDEHAVRSPFDHRNLKLFHHWTLVTVILFVQFDHWKWTKIHVPFRDIHHIKPLNIDGYTLCCCIVQSLKIGSVDPFCQWKLAKHVSRFHISNRWTSLNIVWFHCLTIERVNLWKLVVLKHLTIEHRWTVI